MSCNSCYKTYSLLRTEKGCPGCGFSFCSKCLSHKTFVPKLNSEVKVCRKCKNMETSTNKDPEPPAVYIKRINNQATQSESLECNKVDPVEEEIRKRLNKLKEDTMEQPMTTEQDIAERLKKLKGMPSTSQEEIEKRLANIKGVPIGVIQSKPVLPTPDLRTEQEKADDLMKQYLAETNIDTKYKDEFEEKIGDIQIRLQKLKGSQAEGGMQENIPAETEDDIIRKIIEKAKFESDEELESTNDELPFCEICNEDAVMRCLGCKYLFCKHCFMEHRDDDDGCDKYEKYTPPKRT